MAETQVVIYFGPPAWFHEQVGTGKVRNLVTLALGLDEQQRQLRVVGMREGDDESPPKPRRPRRVAAESSDFASLSEHVLSNFARLVRTLRPRELYINNPPARVYEQLVRMYKGVKEVHFAHPTVTDTTLLQFDQGFADHLVGQKSVKDLLLAAMYPLVRPNRDKPIVLMLYGPSGVGKTQTAQFINDLLGGSLLRKQFSMYHSDKFASYIFGGGHSEASFARDLLDRESGVILIDEFDKANPVFHSAFYQLFDDGRFIDKNYTVKLGPSLIICTSNYASEAEIKESLGDALASRFDALIEFEHLTEPETMEVMERIVDHRLSHMDRDEAMHFNRADVLQRLRPLAKNSSNVRLLGKSIDTVLSLMLVRSVIEASRDGNNASMERSLTAELESPRQQNEL
ncbi:AAA family ATPase [Aquipuribacter sp. MA13-6]|uniref:AAA family ATPase n=1 Tax=unclassified Aquipuribacter TaxID=2635084 RepID=UPI003EE980B8